MPARTHGAPADLKNQRSESPLGAFPIRPLDDGDAQFKKLPTQRCVSVGGKSQGCQSCPAFQCTGDHGIGRSSPCRKATMHPSDRFADSLAGMICSCRLLAIGLALSFTALACSRTPMDQQQGVTTNTISSGGGATTVTTGGTTGTIGNTGGGGTTSTTGGTLDTNGDTNGTTGSGGTAGTIGTPVLRGVFVPTGSMTVARSQHTATMLPNGKVLLAGGLDVNLNYFAGAELYE